MVLPRLCPHVLLGRSVGLAALPGLAQPPHRSQLLQPAVLLAVGSASALWACHPETSQKPKAKERWSQLHRQGGEGRAGVPPRAADAPVGSCGTPGESTAQTCCRTEHNQSCLSLVWLCHPTTKHPPHTIPLRGGGSEIRFLQQGAKAASVHRAAALRANLPLLSHQPTMHRAKLQEC